MLTSEATSAVASSTSHLSLIRSATHSTGSVAVWWASVTVASVSDRSAAIVHSRWSTGSTTSTLWAALVGLALLHASAFDDNVGSVEQRVVEIFDGIVRHVLSLHVNEAATVHDVAFSHDSIFLE